MKHETREAIVEVMDFLEEYIPVHVTYLSRGKVICEKDCPACSMHKRLKRALAKDGDDGGK